MTKDLKRDFLEEKPFDESLKKLSTFDQPIDKEWRYCIFLTIV